VKYQKRVQFVIPDSTIYENYFGEFDLVTKYNSPFPFRDDPIPSFMFKDIGGGIIMWTDFGLSTEGVWRDGIGFVSVLHSISREEAAKMIWRDLYEEGGTSLKPVKIAPALKLDYEFKLGPLRDFELSYWQEHCLEEEDLIDVFSVRRMSKFGKPIWKSEEDNPVFLYRWGEDQCKVYRPLDKYGDKFRGQNNGSVIEGYNILPPVGQNLFITKSYKDVLVLRKAGYHAVAPPSENSWKKVFPPKVTEFNNRFRKVFVMFDNDRAGVIASRELSSITGWEYVYFSPGTKDPADLVRNNKSYFSLQKFLYDVTRLDQ